MLTTPCLLWQVHTTESNKMDVARTRPVQIETALSDRDALDSRGMLEATQHEPDPAGLRALYAAALHRGAGNVDRGLVELSADVIAADYADDLLTARDRIVHPRAAAALAYCEELSGDDARRRAGTIAALAANRAQELLDEQRERQHRACEVLAANGLGEEGNKVVEIADLLARSGLKALPEHLEPAAIEAPLRALAGFLRSADPLRRAVTRAAAIDLLKARGVGAPATMVDAALGTATTTDAQTGQGATLVLCDPEPWPLPVDGSDLLTELRGVFIRYLVLPAHAADMLSLWVIHTYAIGAVFLSPVLGILSPEKRCGKTTLLELLAALSRRAVLASNITPAALFRTVESATPTLLIDEADAFFARNDELRGIVDAGHTRTGARVIRNIPMGDRFEPRFFSTFCAKAIAAIGRLPGTVEDRAILIRMKRRARGERVERLRRDRIDCELEPLRRRATRWVADHLDAIKSAEPVDPDGLNDRALDNWRPLLAIGDLAGGEWAERARKAAMDLSGADDEDSGLRIELLADIWRTFVGEKATNLATETLLRALNSMVERPWSEISRGKPLNARVLARLLKPFEIASKTVRLNAADTPKGYARTDFEDAVARYLPAESATAPQPAPALEKVGVSHPPQAGECGTSENTTSPYSNKPCGVVAATREVIEL